MSKEVRILAFAGSTRVGSYNKKLLTNAIEVAEKEGAMVTRIELKDLQLPLFDADDESEHGIPDNGMKLMNLMISHDAFMIASPEYNSSFSGVLKNAIDWASRPVKGLKPLIAFDGKPVLLMSASPGTLGGLRGLYSLRTVLSNIKCHVSPQLLAIGMAASAFDEQGLLKDEKKMSILNTNIRKFMSFVKALKEPAKES